MKKIAVIGECMVEIKVAQQGVHIGFGGDTMNSAIYLSRLGQLASFNPLQVSYFSAFGADEKSAQIVSQCEQQGVDMSHCLRLTDKQSGLYLIETDAQGERRFSYWRDNSAARFWLDHVEDEQLFEILKGYSFIYLSGITLAILSADKQDRLLALIAQLRKVGCQIGFDSNYRPMLWESPTTTRKIYQRIYPMTDLALLTFDDEAALFGDSSPQATIERVQALGVKEVVVKCGSEPCWIAQAGQQQQISAESVSRVVDTTAAGDSFNAGYMAARLSQLPPAIAAKVGHQLAGTVIGHQGAIIDRAAMPTFKQSQTEVMA